MEFQKDQSFLDSWQLERRLEQKEKKAFGEFHPCYYCCLAKAGWSRRHIWEGVLTLRHDSSLWGYIKVIFGSSAVWKATCSSLLFVSCPVVRDLELLHVVVAGLSPLPFPFYSLPAPPEFLNVGPAYFGLQWHDWQLAEHAVRGREGSGEQHGRLRQSRWQPD